jgi:hypothetical protein
MISELSSGRAAVEYGPISMVITAKRGDDPLTCAAVQAGQEAENILKQLAPFYQLAKKLPAKIKSSQIATINQECFIIYHNNANKSWQKQLEKLLLKLA